ncbi:MAG: energy transducer TonB [Bacteroidetes bacterium]|nr:energy transducer TonB [Bacteroidota bacterium]
MKNLINASDNFTELLFEKRNKNYGAYILRKEYEQNLLKSFSTAMLSVLLFAGIFAVLNQKNAETILPLQKKEFEQIKIEIDLTYLNKTKVMPLAEKVHVAQSKSEANKDVVAEIKDDAPIVETIKPAEDLSAHSAVSTSGSTSELPAVLQTGASGSESAGGMGLGETTKNLAEIDIAPEFPGGIDKLMEFLSHHIVYPMQAKENGIKGTVYVSFMVDKNGKVKEVKIAKGLYSACDAEVMRVVNLFPPWKPGIYKGKNVNVVFSLPVKFELR